MRSLRTKETQKKYDDYKKSGGISGECNLCKSEPIKSFGRWRIIDNDFPYDRIADTHHMIISNRHITEDDITDEEWEEFKKLKKGYIDDNYNFIFENTIKTKTIPNHLHFQLMVVK